MKTTLHLAPGPLLQAFHVRPIVIDGGSAQDFVDTACKFYLLWRSQYAGYLPTLKVAGRSHEAAVLNHALFGHEEPTNGG